MSKRLMWALVALVVSVLVFSADLCAEKTEGAADIGDIQVISKPIIQGNHLTEFGGQVTSVDMYQIEALGAFDISGALRTAPGVNITRYDHVASFGGGSGGSVFIHGMNSSRPGGEVQTMIDGVPVYNAVWNHPLIDLLPISAAGRIEIYKGAQPMSFGNGFGLIDIIPHRRLEPGFEHSGKIAYGMFNTIDHSVSSAGKKGIFDYSFGEQFVRSSGHRDASGGRLFNVYGQIGFDLSDAWDLRLFGLFTDNRADDPGQEGLPATRQGRYLTRGGVADLTVTNTYEKFDGEFKFYWSGGKGDWLNQAGNADDTNSDWLLGGFKLSENVHLWKGGTITAGVDLDLIDGDCDFTYDDGKVDHFVGPVLSLVSGKLGVSQLIGSRDSFFVKPSAGFRFYEHSDFPSKFAPQAGVVFGYKDTDAHVSYSRGVNYPGLNVIVFSKNVVPVLGDSWKSLKPETVDHVEVGVSQGISDWFTADITFFYDRGRNRYVMVTTTPPPHFDNVSKFTIYGVEGSIGVTPIKSLSFFTGATYLHTEPSDLPYAPSFTTSFGLGWNAWKGLHIDLDGEYVSTMHTGSWARTSNASNPSTVEGFYLMNARLKYDIYVKALETHISPYIYIENITNTDYEYQPGYPMPGISTIGGVSFVF